MSMNPRYFRDTFLAPALHRCDLWSQEAENLLLGTAAQESQFVYTRQIGGGPALGYFQMETATHDDCWGNYLHYQSDLREKVLTIRRIKNDAPEAIEMISDHAYASIMARVRYRRVSASLPTTGLGCAEYWKQYYNTPEGGGTIQEFIDHWNLLLVPTGLVEAI